MRNTIKWSCDLLAASDLDVFARLAVFAGGFTVEAAELVCSDDVADVEVLDSLTNLVDSSLLASREMADGEVRMSMLEVVREYALERFSELPGTEILRERHAACFLDLAERAEAHLQGAEATVWLERLESEHDNMRAALAWSLNHQPQTAARIAAALRFFWANHSHLREGLQWSRAALDTTENMLSEARLKLLLSTGLFLKNHGELDAARQSYEKCSDESRRMGDRLQAIKSGHGLAAVAVLQQDLAGAELYLKESLTLAREYGDGLQLAYLLGSFGDLEMCRGNLAAARPLLDECLSLAAASASERILTTVYFNIGTIDYLEGLHGPAAAYFTRSLEIAERLGNKTMIACCLDGFAAMAGVSGSPQNSVRLAAAAEALREKIGCPVEPAEATFRQTYLTHAQETVTPSQYTDLYAEGRTLSLSDALALAREAGEARGEGVGE
jgi:non-specific serine/threonine protein kinase